VAALGLGAADFDAFLEPANSPAASRAGAARPGAAAQRRALRERIETWAHGVVPRLEQIGLALEVVVPDELEQHLSSRAPRAIAQRVVFVRDDFSRASVPRLLPELDPLRAHAHLALTIDSVHVEVSLEVGPDAEADVKNLRARIADPTALLELTGLLEAMPDEFAIGVIGVPSFPRAQSATADDVRALLDDSQRNGRPLWIGWSLKREIAVAHARQLDEELADAVVALAHVYKMIAWAPDNDRIAAGGKRSWRALRARARELDERRERGREERRTRRAASKKGTPVRVEGSRREREDARRQSSAESREPPASRLLGDRDRDRDVGGDVDKAKPDFLAASRALPRRPVLPTTLRARGARPMLVPPVDPSTPLEKGTHVRVLAGPFEGKLGVVEGIDGRGRARVRLGLLAATLEMKDIIAAPKDGRPMLGSSHRRVRRPRSR
jgi:hypothetical protein